MKIFLNDEQKMNEIIFANRNKRYGAYAIRASYNATLFRALFIVSSTVFLFAGICYILSHREEAPPIVDVSGIVETTVTITPVDPVKPVDPPENHSKAPKSSAIATTFNDTVHEPEHGVVENNPVGAPDGDTTGIGPTPFAGTGTGSNPPVEVPDEIPTTMFPEEDPVFEGGAGALRNFLARNTVYPQLAKEVYREGTVYVSFVVNEKGVVESIKIVRGIGAGCDEEAARVVAKLPKFTKPGYSGGRAVKVLYNVPIKFSLK